MNVREFLTKWGFEIEHEKLNKVEQQLEGIKHRLDFLAAAEVVKGLYELAERFGHFAEELEVTATSAGITVEAFQRLSFTAQQSAVSQEEMGMSLRRLSRTLYMSRTGSEEAQKAFAQVGFDQSQVASFKTSKDALFALADRFKNIHDPIQKAALAQQLLGRNSQHMVAYLSQGSKALREQEKEADTLGIVLGKGQVEGLTKAIHTFEKFAAILKAIAATIAAEVAPVFEYLIKDFIEFFKANRQLIQINIEKWLITVAYAMGFVWGFLKTLTLEVLKFAKAWGFQDRIFSLIAGFASLVTALFVVKKAFSLLGIVMDYLSFGWNIAKMFWAISTASWAAVAPFIPMIAAIGLLVVAVQGLWTVLNGGKLSDTWIGKFWEWLKTFEILKGTLEYVEAFLSSILQKIADVSVAVEQFGVKRTLEKGFEGVKTFFGYGKTGETTPEERITGPGSVSNAVSSFANTSNVGGNYSVEAPITVNVPAGTNPGDVGAKVKEGVMEHLARVYRETQRSTATPVAY
jgi:hypothetical protein